MRCHAVALFSTYVAFMYTYVAFVITQYLSKILHAKKRLLPSLMIVTEHPNYQERT